MKEKVLLNSDRGRELVEIVKEKNGKFDKAKANWYVDEDKKPIFVYIEGEYIILLK